MFVREKDDFIVSQQISTNILAARGACLDVLVIDQLTPGIVLQDIEWCLGDKRPCVGQTGKPIFEQIRYSI